MLQGFKNSWNIIIDSFRIFTHHPVFLVPLMLTWMVYAPIILWIEFSLDTKKLTFMEDLFYALGIVFVFAFILSLSCSLLLELIQQKESGQKLNLLKACSDTFRHNMVNMLPIILLWTVVWFLLLVVQAFFSKGKESDEKEELTAENAARALADGGQWSFSKAFFRALQKIVRMGVFLILPAIAWENMDFVRAWKRGMHVLSLHKTEFVSGFILTEGVAFLIFLPVGILFFVTSEMHVPLPDYIWLISIMYISVAWSYSLYVEQMFTALLFLWHRKWEKEVEIAKSLNMPPPPFSKTEKPSLLDDIHEFPQFQ